MKVGRHVPLTLGNVIVSSEESSLFPRRFLPGEHIEMLPDALLRVDRLLMGCRHVSQGGAVETQS